MADGGAFAESGAPQHAKEQNVVENVKQLAEACRAAGIPVIHVHYIVEEGAPTWLLLNKSGQGSSAPRNVTGSKKTWRGAI